MSMQLSIKANLYEKLAVDVVLVTHSTDLTDAEKLSAIAEKVATTVDTVQELIQEI